jgi:hypothetical protein
MSFEEPSHESVNDMVLVSGSDYIRMCSVGGGYLSMKLPTTYSEAYVTTNISGQTIAVDTGAYIDQGRLSVASIRESGSNQDISNSTYTLFIDPSTKEISYSDYITSTNNTHKEQLVLIDQSLNIYNLQIKALDISNDIFTENVVNSSTSIESIHSILGTFDSSLNLQYSFLYAIDNSLNIINSIIENEDISVNLQLLELDKIDASINLIDTSMNILTETLYNIDISNSLIYSNLNSYYQRISIVDSSLNFYNYIEELFNQGYSDTFSLGKNSSATGSNSLSIGYNSSVVNTTDSVAIGKDVSTSTNEVITIGNSSQNIGIIQSAPSYRLDVSGTLYASNNITTSSSLYSNGGCKLVVQGDINGGSGQGIYLWTNDDTNWGIYMAQSGAGRALDDGTAPEGYGFTSHAVRFRCYNDGNYGFIFENSANMRALEIRRDGYVYSPYTFRTGDWLRSNGDSGWYNETYGGGIRMEDSTWVKIYGAKKFACYYHLAVNVPGHTWRMSNYIDDNLGFYYDNVLKGYIEDDGGVIQHELNFTGQHRTFIENINYYDASYNQGLIVCANKNAYINMNEQIYKGNKAITQDECLPIVSLSNKTEDKTCFGVISGSEDSEKRIERFGNFVTPYEKEQGDTRIYINSIGEGAMWVSNRNGPLESGDYITTTDIPGYGMKQDLEILCNYTVAKITMDCDFNPQLQPKEIILKQESLDASGNTIYENILDVNGMIQWTNELDTSGNIVYEHPYNLRYLDLSGNRYTKHEYDIKLTDVEELYIAAYVGCTYHCG